MISIWQVRLTVPLSPSSVRKNIDSLKQALTSVVVPIYCLTYVESDGETRQKLMKLEKIWETNNYLDRSIIEQLRNPQISLNNYRQALCNEYGNLLAPITAGTMAKFNQLQQQHNDFVNHQNSKIREIQVSTSLPPTSLSMSTVNNSVSQGPCKFTRLTRLTELTNNRLAIRNF